MSTVPDVTTKQDIPTGSDTSELFPGREEKILEVEHKGKKWVFKYRLVSWREKYEAIDAAQVWENEGVQFSLSRYYSTMLKKMITSSPIQPLTETTLNALDENVGAQLLSIVPPPADISRVSILKKE